MKYPWVGISLAVMWFGSAYIIINNPQIDSSIVLFTAIIGTVAVAFIGFRAPKSDNVFLTKILGDSNKRFLKKLEPVVSSINTLEEK